jgi:hypothetical protein
VDSETCHRCDRRTAFRYWSWDENNKKIAFCTWFCARAHHLVTGHAVEGEDGKIVIPPADPIIHDPLAIKREARYWRDRERELETPAQAALRMR